jgi:hypothetical protein
VLIGSVAVLTAIGLGLPRRGRRPHRIPAAVLLLLGVLAVGFGVLRLVSPDPLSILDAGEGSASYGQGFTVLAGVLLLGAGAAVLAGATDPRAPVPRRGIQP